MDSAIDVARTQLAAAGFHQLAADITGDTDLVVRPDRALTWPEAEAFVKIRRKAYLAAGLRPCDCGDTGECPTSGEDGLSNCFADDEGFMANQLRLLQLPNIERRNH